MENQILGVFGGIAELPSSLELVQGIYDKLYTNGADCLEHPLKSAILLESAQSVISTWANKRGIIVQLSTDELHALVDDVDQHWSMSQQETFLKRLDDSYTSYRSVKSASKKKAKAEKQEA
jgi:CRISPR-associated protein Csc2